MRVYWEKCGAREGNFGDKLTALILDYLDIPHEWAPPTRAELFGIGSILESIPEGFTGVVWTSGQIHEKTCKDLRRATVLGLRGPETLARTQLAPGADTVLGDGGLLCDLLYRPVRPRYKLGLVPHYVDSRNSLLQEVACSSEEITVIDICGSAREVIQQVGQCHHILSSSLHGLILADSLGIPNLWMEPDDGPTLVLGAGFKFRDYLAAFGITDQRPLRLHKTDNLDSLLPRFGGYARPGIDRVKSRLLASLRDLPRVSGVPLWTEADLQIARREAGILARLGPKFPGCSAASATGSRAPVVAPSPVQLPPGEVLSTNQVRRAPLSQVKETLRGDTGKLARFFVGCLRLLRQLNERGVLHRAISVDKILVANGEPILCDFGWATADDRQLFEPCDAGAKGPLSSDRDVRAMGRVLMWLTEGCHIELGVIARMMAADSSEFGVKDLDVLEAMTSAMFREASNVEVIRQLLTITAHLTRDVDRLETECAEQSTMMWDLRRSMLWLNIQAIVPSGETYILVDDGQLATSEEVVQGRRNLPFLERDGCYAGPPGSTEEALSELNRMSNRGARFIVFAWPAIWWLEHFAGLASHLRSNFLCTCERSELVVFDLSRKRTAESE